MNQIFISIDFKSNIIKDKHMYKKGKNTDKRREIKGSGDKKKGHLIEEKLKHNFIMRGEAEEFLNLDSWSTCTKYSVSEKLDHQKARLQSLTAAIKGYPMKQCAFIF